MGAVLFQIKPDSTRSIISYASAKFSPTQARYEKDEHECLAIIWALNKFTTHLQGHPFILRTDDEAVTWLHSMKETRGKLRQWACQLGTHTFKVEKCLTSRSLLPVALAGTPDGPNSEEDTFIDERLLPPEHKNNEFTHSPYLAAVRSVSLYDEIILAQQADDQVCKLVSQWKRLVELPVLTEKDKLFLHQYTLNESGLWRTNGPIPCSWLLYVPEKTRELVLYEYHDSGLSGHPGMDETIHAIQQRFFWPKMREDIREYVQSCRFCACCKPLRIAHRDQQRPREPRNPWETVALDLMGPYPKSGQGKSYLLVITHLFSRWVEAFPLGNAKASQILETLEREVFRRYGYPRSLLTDNGPQFTGRTWIEACQEWSISCWTTPTYHPRANPTERRNQDLKKGMRLRLAVRPHKDWDCNIPEIHYNTRTRKNAATGLTVK